MFVSTRLRTAGAVIAASAVLFGAGCSSDGNSTSTDSASAGSISADADSSAQSALDTVRAAYETTANQEVQRGRIEAQGSIVTTTIDTSRDVILGQIPNSPHGPMQVLFEGDDLFAQFTDVPEASASILEADVWYRVDVASDQTGQMFLIRDLVRNRQQSSALLAEFTTGAEEQGTEVVEAADATRFTATLDVAAYADALLETFADSLPTGPGTPSADDMRRIMIEQTPTSLELWIDDNGRIVREVFAGNDTTTSYDIDFVVPEFDRANAPLAPIS